MTRDQFLAARYKDRPGLIEPLTKLYQEYDSRHLKDSTFDEKLIDGREDHYFGGLWEALLARHLISCGLTLRSEDIGPDFKIINYDGPIWVEAICPSPEGLPSSWLAPHTPNHVRHMPHEDMLLRWTAALKEKFEKLAGRVPRNATPGAEERRGGYLNSGVVGSSEPYVVAIGSCRLGPDSLTAHYGISQLPFAVEAAFPVGPHEVIIDRHSLEVSEVRQSYRPSLSNKNQAQVRTDSFLNPEYAAISAIFGSPAGETAAAGGYWPTVVVHNPNATNPLAVGILGADEEYTAIVRGSLLEIKRIA